MQMNVHKQDHDPIYSKAIQLATPGPNLAHGPIIGQQSSAKGWKFL